MINKENYQSYLLDRIEGVLSEKDNKELDKFLEQNPELIPLEDEYETFGGFIFGLLGTVPEDGSTPELEEFFSEIKVIWT